MLAQILELLKQKENGLSVSELSRALNAQPSAVMAMIHLLTQKGKIIEIDPDGNYCAACGEKSNCSLLAAHGSRYAVKQ